MILCPELGGAIPGECPTVDSDDGESAAGLISEAGAGAGAELGGISVPKMASGRSTLSTW